MDRTRLALLAFAVVVVATACGSGDALRRADRLAATRPPPAATTQPVSTPSTAATPFTAPTPRASFLIYDPQLDVKLAIAGALEEASRDGKRVLLNFGADWCPFCRALHAKLETRAGRARLKDFHLIYVDVGERDRNLDVSAMYGDTMWWGIPSLVVLGPDGNVVGREEQWQDVLLGGTTKELVWDFLERMAG